MSLRLMAAKIWQSHAVTSLQERLRAGQKILIDGATGTDIERRGVPMTDGAWCGNSAFTHPDDVRAVHLNHIEAGAELIIANTYASSRHVLANADLQDSFEDVNRIGARLALEAREQSGRTNVTVAGSMSTTPQGAPFPPLEQARANYLEQARILADEGVDIIVLEMMREIDHTEVCLEAALTTGLPVWLGVSRFIKDGGSMMGEGHDTLEAFMQKFGSAPIEVLSVMHTEADDVDACLDVIQQHWNGPIGVYAQSGRFDPPDWVFIDVISAEDYAAKCAGWLERGVQVIGGCCGIGHEHIAHLNTIL